VLRLSREYTGLPDNSIVLSKNERIKGLVERLISLLSRYRISRLLRPPTDPASGALKFSSRMAGAEFSVKMAENQAQKRMLMIRFMIASTTM
jgi:hypothetical protein